MIIKIKEDINRKYYDKAKDELFKLLDAYVNNRAFFDSLVKKGKIYTETITFINAKGMEIESIYEEVSIDYFRIYKCNELLEIYCKEIEQKEKERIEAERIKEEKRKKKQELEEQHRKQIEEENKVRRELAEKRIKEMEEENRIRREESLRLYNKIKSKYSQPFRILDKYVEEKKIKAGYRNEVAEILLNMYVRFEQEKKKKPKVIGFCEIETSNGLRQEIVLVENSEYLKLRNGTFCWEIEKTLGKKCLSCMLNNKESFECSGYTYKVKKSFFLNPKFEKENKIKKIDVRMKKGDIKRNYPKNCIYVFFKLNNSCSMKGHNVESVTLQATDLIKEKDVDVNAFYCKDCDFYYMNYETLKLYIDDNIRPKLKFRIVGDSIFELNAVSELMLYGYTVREGALTEQQRRNVLISLIENGLMTKYEIIRNIESKVEFNGKKSGNETAKQKWQEDILFISKYTSDNKRTISGMPYR